MDRESRVLDEYRRRTIKAVATFSALMHAHERADQSKIESTQRSLDRLGILVKFTSGCTFTRPKGVSRGK